jgi:hypothetical protein
VAVATAISIKKEPSDASDPASLGKQDQAGDKPLRYTAPEGTFDAANPILKPTGIARRQADGKQRIVRDASDWISP